MSDKPTALKPAYYAIIAEGMKKIAKEFGYNLVLHGSLNRDMDVILIPWVDQATDPDDLVTALAKYLGGKIQTYGDPRDPLLSSEVINGAGRRSYIINLHRSGPVTNYLDKEYYIDISVTPKKINR